MALTSMNLDYTFIFKICGTLSYFDTIPKELVDETQKTIVHVLPQVVVPILKKINKDIEDPPARANIKLYILTEEAYNTLGH